MSKKAKRKQMTATARTPLPRPRKGSRLKIVVPVVAVALLLVAAAWMLWSRIQPLKPATQPPAEANATRASKSTFNQPTTFLELCNTPTEQLEKCDIALMNLLCAEGLPGAENLSVRETLERLDGIAKGVKFETDRHIYKYRQNPGEFKNLEGYYRMMMMATVLQQDLGIHYNPERIQMPNQPLESNEKFFANSQDVFIHGLSRKNGTGTCSSMPVFYVAVGRRLGYPLKLVTAQGHLFARWDEGEKSFNIEGTTIGFGSYPDDYYRSWPASFTPEEEENEGFLKSLTPVQELTVFLSIRGQCLRSAMDYKKALGAFAQAFYREPKPESRQALLGMAEREAFEAGALPKRDALRYALRTLEIPPGPMQALQAMRRLDLMQMLDNTNVVETEVEGKVDMLRAEIMAATRR